MTILILLAIWIGFGILAELIGIIYYWDWNGIGNALLIIALGGIAFLGMVSEIDDEEFEKRCKY